MIEKFENFKKIDVKVENKEAQHPTIIKEDNNQDKDNDLCILDSI